MLSFRVNLRALFHELLRLFFHPLLQRSFLGDALFGGVFADVFGDFHRAEVRAAHGAKVRGLGAVLRQRLVVEFARGHGVEREVELIFPAEFKARLGDGVVAVLRAGMALRQVRRVRRDLVGDDAVFHVLLVRQAEVFLGRNVAEHRAAIPANHRRTDAAGDVVVAGRDVGGERPERVERRFAAPFELLVHVLLDHVQRHVAGAFVHDLHALGPCALGQFALDLKFTELRLVIRIGNAAGPQSVADGKRNIIRGHDVADFVPVGVEEIFLVMREAPFGHDAAAARDDARHAVGRERHKTQQHAGVDGEIVHALLGLFDEGVAEQFPREVFRAAVDLFQRLVNRHGADGHGRVAQNPFPRGVNILAGGQIHDGVRTPFN